MVVSQAECMKFLFRRKTAAWVFDANPRMFAYPVLIPESQAKTLAFGRIMLDYPRERLNRCEFVVYHDFKINCGTKDRPLFNGVSGFERQRGLAISTTKRYPNMVDYGNIRWEGESDAGLRFYLLPESQILWSIEETWKNPLKTQWVTEAVYAVVPDLILKEA